MMDTLSWTETVVKYQLLLKIKN